MVQIASIFCFLDFGFFDDEGKSVVRSQTGLASVKEERGGACERDHVNMQEGLYFKTLFCAEFADL